MTQLSASVVLEIANNGTPAPTSTMCSCKCASLLLLPRLTINSAFICLIALEMNHQSEWLISEIEVSLSPYTFEAKCVENSTGKLMWMERCREAQLQSHLMELCWICCWTIVRLFEWKLFLMETNSEDDALRGKICFPKWISCCWLRRIEKFSFRLSSLVFCFVRKFKWFLQKFCFSCKSYKNWWRKF